jgi:nucleoside-diphosphate-sugar epimerase
MDRMKILITGGNGYIANGLYNNLKSIHDITLITRKDFDLTDSKATGLWFEDKYFDIIIHTAVVGGSRLKPEDSSIMDQNLQMYYNLLTYKDHYKKFIHFGSGAETHLDTPYDIINHLNGHQVEIKLNNSGIGTKYIGKFTDLGINYIGLEQGIIETYNKLKNEH